MEQNFGTMTSEELDAATVKMLEPTPSAEADGNVTPPAVSSEAGSVTKVEPTPNPSQEGTHPLIPPQGGNPPATPTPSPAATLLAGKYKTVDDLAKGMVEIGKPLGINTKVLETTVALAKKTGDWTEVENLYKELDTELSSKQAAEAERARQAEEARRTAGQEPLPKETPAPGTGLNEAQQVQLVFEETYREIATHPLVREMAEEGIDLPRTKEDWQTLKRDNPYYATEFGKLFAGTYADIQKELKEMVGVLTTAENENKTMMERNITLIKDKAKRVGLNLSDADIATVVEAAKKSPTSYQQKHGVSLLTEDGIYRHWLLTNEENILKQLEITAEARGRTQAAEDFKKLKKETLNTLSTTAVHGKREAGSEKKEVTADNRGLLGEAELETEFEKMMSAV